MKKTEATTETPRKRRTLTPEIEAMAKIDAILCALEPAATGRVLDWINAKFDTEAEMPVDDAIEAALEAGR